MPLRTHRDVLSLFYCIMVNPIYSPMYSFFRHIIVLSIPSHSGFQCQISALRHSLRRRFGLKIVYSATFHWSSCTKTEKSVVMYMCDLAFDLDTVSTILRLDFGNVPTVWYLWGYFHGTLKYYTNYDPRSSFFFALQLYFDHLYFVYEKTSRWFLWYSNNRNRHLVLS